MAYDKVFGVDAANIGKVFGVDVANIGKVFGEGVPEEGAPVVDLDGWDSVTANVTINYTAPAGTNRAVVLFASNESVGAWFSTCTGYTGNMVRAAYASYGNNALTGFYEVIGTSVSTTAMTLTVAGATASNHILLVGTFANVKQVEGATEVSGPTLALYNEVEGGANAATPGDIYLTGSPAIPDNGLVVYGINVNGTIGIATPSGFSEEVQVIGGSNISAAGARTVTTESDSVQLNVATETSTANRWEAIEIGLNPA